MVDDRQKRKPGLGSRAGGQASAREAARIEALRANLVRRKAQARGRAGREADLEGSPDGPNGEPRRGDA
jgi:hypothetical protein